MTDREIAEMIAKFRTPPGFNWEPLADDMVTLLRYRLRPYEPSVIPQCVVCGKPAIGDCDGTSVQHRH